MTQSGTRMVTIGAGARLVGLAGLVLAAVVTASAAPCGGGYNDYRPGVSCAGLGDVDIDRHPNGR